MRSELKIGLGYITTLKPEQYWLAIIILIAVFLRGAMAFYLGGQVVVLPGAFDQISYDMLAQQVLDGHGFTVARAWWPNTPAGEPTAHWSYLYTLYLAMVYSLVGYHPLVARLIQAILAGVLMPWLVYGLGRRIFNYKVGLVGAGLTAIYLYFVYYAAALMTETFYIMAILWTLNLAVQLGQPTDQAGNQNSRFQWFWLGLALGVTVLFRQVFLPFIPVLFGWLLWRSYRYQVRSVLCMIGILLGASAILLLLIAPWTARNYRAFDTFVLLNTNAGFAFFWGNHPIHGYNFISILPVGGPSYQELIPSEFKDLNEADLDRALLKRGLGFIQAEPERYLILSISRFKDDFKFWPSPDSGLISNVSRVLSFGLLFPFMIFGFVYYLPRSLSSTALILYLFVFVYTMIHLLSWTLIRYRLPVDAVLLVFAGAALVKFRENLILRYAKKQNILRYKTAP